MHFVLVLMINMPFNTIEYSQGTLACIGVSTSDMADGSDIDILPQDEQLLQEDTLQDNSTDLSRRRLGELKAIIKNILYKYHGQVITEHHFFEADQTMSCQEIQICLPLANAILPYIPSKENCYLIGFQLPFVLFANDVLQYAGYAKFCRNICPLTSPTSLNALNIDAPSIYSILSQTKQDPITIFDFEGCVIGSTEEARARKDATFYSLFDLTIIRKICASRRLEFGHYITILPGLKLVRITGTRASKAGTSKKKPQHKRPMRDLPWSVISKLQEKNDNTLKLEIAELNNNLKGLLNELKHANKTNKEQDWSKVISVAKSKWIRATLLTAIQRMKNDALYTEIQNLKREKYETQRKIQLLKKEVSQVRFEKFIRNKAITFRNKEPMIEDQNKHTIERHERYIGKAENMTLAGENVSKDYTFSGTDNGLVTLSETIPFSLDRFNYHLNLYNTYAPLAEDTQHDHGQSIPFHSLASSFKVNSSDIDFGGGYRRQRKKLERDKKNTQGGQFVMEAERKFSGSSKNTTTIEEIVAIHQEKRACKNVFRNFYYSNKQVSISKSVMFLNKRYRDRLCSKERRYAQGDEKKHLIMMIGDRGFGYGSRIKGFRRYGGKWKPQLHGKNTTVCITNEHKTSQTCVYCFSPIVHPMQRQFSGGKEIRKECRGAFQCINSKCISVINKKSIQTRDKVSALAIGLSGMSHLLFGETFPVFTPKCISQFNTDFNNNIIPPSFRIESEVRAYCDAV